MLPIFADISDGKIVFVLDISAINTKQERKITSSVLIMHILEVVSFSLKHELQYYE